MLLNVISVLHLKKPTSLVDGELRQHRARSKNIAMTKDVMAIHLTQDPPIF
jgi:hypothetical protein